jgi:2-keto-4-pentenoate hydratase/2-oxohepta-3-ene-1,7-dioic acid hydratase in catechol pathway
MRFVRYTVGGGAPRYGWIFQDKVGPIEGEPFGEYRRLEAGMPLDRVRLLAPLVPGKIIAVGRNYADPGRERAAAAPEIPLIFLKPPSAVIGPEETIVVPPQSQRVDHEAELAAVIGKTGRWIHAEDALQYVLGYTAANDVTARDLQQKDGQWTRGKGFDTFCPLGPWIETDLDPADLRLTCRVNGEMRQLGSTREMIFSVQQLIAFASSVMTLNPGDVLLTGTPAGVGPLVPSDTVEVEIEGLGVLRNPVAAAPR